MIRYILFWVLKIEGFLLLLPMLVGTIYGESQWSTYLIFAIAALVVGFLGSYKKPKNTEIYQREGFAAVALSWIVMSAYGALPFVATKEIPHFIDALFEIVSGFTTTGASILSDVEALSHASLFWRSFSHWIGGMGVLVFILMLIPVRNGSQMNLMRAESPGPDVSKFVPRVRNTAIILYRIYIVMTLVQIVILILTGMQVFDALCISFGTAGTGGFAVLNASAGSYTALQQVIITVFMILFGVNFAAYYLVLCRKPGQALKMEEVRAYIVIILAAVALITWNVHSMYPTFGESLRHSFFQVGSIITTTGFSTTDFNTWPALSKGILLTLMCIGACAGSTGGGIKVSRVVLLFKSIKRELASIVHPRGVKNIRMDDRPVTYENMRAVNVFFILYVIVFATSLLLISFNELPFETNFSAVAATLNNIGPGLDMVGPTANYAVYGVFSKIVLTIDMLAGRLELIPVLVLFYPGTWRKR